MKKALFALTLLLAAGQADAATWFVSTSGSGTTGSKASPCGIATAKNGTCGPSAAGDTYWLRGGTYSLPAAGLGNNPMLQFSKSGTAQAPVVYRAYPGEFPVIDFAASTITDGRVAVEFFASNVWLWGLRFTSSSTETRREGVPLPSSYSNGLTRSGGLYSHSGGGPYINNRIINCVVDNLTSGLSIFGADSGTGWEIYGSQFFHMGNDGTPAYVSGVLLDTGGAGCTSTVVSFTAASGDTTGTGAVAPTATTSGGAVTGFTAATSSGYQANGMDCGAYPGTCGSLYWDGYATQVSKPPIVNFSGGCTATAHTTIAQSNNRGVAVYSQNIVGNRRFFDNIMHDNWNNDLHVYSSSGNVDWETAEGNLSVNPGLLARYLTRSYNFLVGTGNVGHPSQGGTLRNNFTYNAMTTGKGATSTVNVGYDAGAYLPRIQNEYHVSDANQSTGGFGGGLLSQTITGEIFTGNTIIASTPIVNCTTCPASGVSGNLYQTNAQWRAAASPAPFIRPNRYEKGRCNIYVYRPNTPTSTKAINIDSCGMLSGQTFDVYDGLNWGLGAIQSGTFSTGVSFTFDTSAATHTGAQPNGWSETTVVTTAPEFTAFIVIPTSGLGVPN